MSTYFTSDCTVYDLDDCLKAIKQRNEDNEETIEYLKEENRKLKEEYSKDEEIQKMKAEVDKAKQDLYRGFPITEREQKKIDNWRKKHEEEVHNAKTFDQRLKRCGCIGGNYKYIFIPTSIGVIGTIKCNCGAEFDFSEI